MNQKTLLPKMTLPQQIAARLFMPAILLLAACSATPQKEAGNAADPALAETQRSPLLPLVIRSASAEHRFRVEVARTAAEQAQGLMFRKSLEPDGGMLFPMAPPRTASFWMKNTVIPLDMIFIRTDGTIAFIAANTVPYSREPVSAGVPVAAVLELRGGRAAELGLKEGNVVTWGRCAASGEGIPADLDFCPAGAR